MSYPQAPWTLCGYAIQTLQLIDVEKTRPFIPPEFEIVSFFPGKTLGGIYVSSYSVGSVLQYNELIVAAGFVSYAGKIGAWISHIYVDNPDSVAGGREIWGLPKELADFTWDNSNHNSQVAIAQNNKQLCTISYSKPSLKVPLPFKGSVFSQLGSNIIMFDGDLSSQIGLTSSKVNIPTESPFYSLNLTQPWLTAYCDDLRFVAGIPEVVGEKAVEFSYS